MFFRIFIAIFLSFCAQVHAQQVPPIAQWLRDAAIPVSSSAVYIAGVMPNSKAIVQINGEQAFNPASVMKLYTTYGALELLGASYTWKTQVLSTAKIQNKTLLGDVYIKGSADPSLKIQDVWRLLRELRLAGVQHIAGDWVLDRSILLEEPHDPNQFDGQAERPYNVAPDGLLMSFNATRLSFKLFDGVWQVVADALPLGWTVEGAVQATAGNCLAWSQRLALSSKSHSKGGVITVGGSIPKACANQDLYRVFAPSPNHAAGLIKTIWSELGGTFSGQIRSGVTVSDAVVLAEVESEPLSTVIRDINKRSNNVMARLLYLNLARTYPLTLTAAENRLRAWLRSVDLNDTSLVFENGSGLSRKERSSAHNIAKLLQLAFAGPLMPEFMSSLAVVAQDGTVQRRMGPVAGYAHLKTGTLDDVAAIAGYVLAASGKRYVIVAMVNHPQKAGANAVFDRMVQWVHQNG